MNKKQSPKISIFPSSRLLIFHFSLKAWHCTEQPKDGRGWPPHASSAWEDFSKMFRPTRTSSLLQHLPILLMYQFLPPWDWFQYRAPAELTKAMTKRMPNSTRICKLVTFSTFDLLRGALVEFCATTFKISEGHRTDLGARNGEKRR